MRREKARGVRVYFGFRSIFRQIFRIRLRDDGRVEPERAPVALRNPRSGMRTKARLAFAAGRNRHRKPGSRPTTGAWASVRKDWGLAFLTRIEFQPRLSRDK
jgi:hypothetical protein